MATPLDVKSMQVEDLFDLLEDYISYLQTTANVVSKEALHHLKFIHNCSVQDGSEKEVERKATLVDKMAELNLPLVFIKVWNQTFINAFKDDGKPMEYNVLKAALDTIWEGTDESDKMCNRCVQQKLHEQIIQYMRHPILFNFKSNPSPKCLHIIHGCLGVLTNLLQRENIREDCKRPELKAVSVINKYQHVDDIMIQCKAAVLLAYFMNEDDNALINADDKHLAFLIDILQACMKEPNHYSKHFGYKASEIVAALNLLSSNEENKIKVVDHGVLPYYVSLMKLDGTTDELERANAAEGVWSLAFSSVCKGKLLKEPGLAEALEKLSKEANNKNTRKQAKGALWVLNSKYEEQRPIFARGESVNGTSPHIMISYQWDSQSTTMKLYDRLKEEGYKVWMDVEEMAGSILESMATAVEDAVVVLVCMTQMYKDSPNCRTEAEYTFKLQKEFIPLLLQANYSADGWLGAMVGNKLYYDFSADDKFEESTIALVRELGDRGKGTSDTREGDEDTESHRDKVSLVSSWSTDQVSTWLSKQGLSHLAQQFSSFDGNLLLEYQSIMHTAPEFFYNSLKQEFGMQLKDILLLSKAMKQIK